MTTDAPREEEPSGAEALAWPDEGITRGDLAAYYREVAPAMLAHLARRPVSLRVWPRGVGGPAHYRRDLQEHAPASIGFVDHATQDGKVIQAPILDEAGDLAWFVERGAIEFHAWNAVAPDIAAPDRAVFDLDPGDRASFDDVLAVALLVRERLAADGLRGYPNTSGGSGLHVHVPLAPGHDFAAVRAWVKGIAERLQEARPELVSAAGGATHAGDLVTLDYAQNSVARTMAARYTARGRPGAPVAAPLAWEEVAAGAVRPADFTIRTMPARLRDLGDLAAPELDNRQRLPG